MYKVAAVFRFRPDLDHAEAASYMTDPHGRRVIARIPGLVRYVQHVVLEPLEFDSDGSGTALLYDAYVSHWYRDRSAFEAAVRSPEWEAAMRDGATFVDMESAAMGAVEERVIDDGPRAPFKTVALARFRNDLDKRAASDYWTNTHGPLTLAAGGFTRYVQNHTIQPGIPGAEGNLGFDGFAEHWFDDRDAFLAASVSTGWKGLGEDGENFLEMGDLWGAIVEERVLVE